MISARGARFRRCRSNELMMLRLVPNRNNDREIHFVTWRGRGGVTPTRKYAERPRIHSAFSSFSATEFMQ